MADGLNETSPNGLLSQSIKKRLEWADHAKCRRALGRQIRDFLVTVYAAELLDEILARYAELYNPPDYKALYEAEVAKNATLTTQLAAEKAKVASATTAGKADMHAKAIVAAENHLATVRALK